MSHYSRSKLKLMPYEELTGLLPERNPIVEAFAKSRKKQQFLDRKFFVYTGDIRADNLLMGLEDFHSNNQRYGQQHEPHIYPVVIGSLDVGSAYFDGFVTGDITANNLYSEYRMENIDIGCGGNLNVRRLYLAKRRRISVYGSAKIHTFVSNNDARIAGDRIEIQYTFRFPKIKRSDDFSHHSLEEVKAHFRNYAADDIPRIDNYYGIDLDAMIPIYHSAGERDTDYINPDR